jgi:hypothetical protein
MEKANLLIGLEVHELVLVNADWHRGRVMAEYANGNGVERFTRRKDGTYRLLGKKDGILVLNERADA